MGCFHSCLGGDDGGRRRPPRRSSPRPNHVSAVRVMSVAADVVVRDASPPLRGARASKSQLAVEVPAEVVRAAPAADAVAREASPPPHRARASKQPSAVEVTADVVGEASDWLLKEEALPLPDEAKASVAPPSVAVAKDVVTSSSSGKDMRESSQQEAPSVGSLLPEKKATPPDSPVKCSPMVVVPVCTQGSLECSPVTAAVVSTSDSELRKLSEHGSRSSGKKKVTFNMNVTTYENAAAPDQDEGYAEDEGESHAQKVAALPENHRYKNCSDSDDDVGDEYAEDEAYGDDSDEEDDYVDCNIDLLDEEEMSSEMNKQDSHESLFSLSISNDQQNDNEVISPAPKSSDTSIEQESPLIKGNNLHCRIKYVRPVLNPVQNLLEWKEVKSLKTQPAPSKMFNKENINIVANVDADGMSNSASQAKMGAGNSSKKEISVDASHNREETPILGTVGSYWSCTRQEIYNCSPMLNSGTHGVPNTTSKYREDQRVNWHSTPFNVRLDRALKKTSA